MWPFLAGLYGRSVTRRHGLRTAERTFWWIVLWFIGLFLWVALSVVVLPPAWLPDEIPAWGAIYWVITAIVVAHRWGE